MLPKEEDVSILTIDKALSELCKGSHSETMIQSLAKLEDDEIQLTVKNIKELKKTTAPPKTKIV